MRERKTVVMLPTSEASRLCNIKFKDGIGASGKSEPNGILTSGPNNDAFIFADNGECVIQPQHLYVLSNEYKRVPIGTWVWNDEDNSIYQTDIDDFDRYHSDHIYEIIATTDAKLWNATWKGGKYEPETPFQEIVSGVARIPTDFIQAYIKAYNEGKPITEIDVEYEIPLQPISLTNGTREITEMSRYGTPVPKLRSDGTIIIHKSEKRVFTEEDMGKAYEFGFRNGIVYDMPEYTNSFGEWLSKNYPL